MHKRLLAILTIIVPMAASAADPYKPDAGPHDITVSEQIIVDAGDRSLSMQIVFPSTSGPYPVVVLSHGGGCEGGSYAIMADHWASHGYVVVQPTHPDSRSTGFDMATVEPRQMEGIIRQRLHDMSVVLDNLSNLETVLPALAGKMDSKSLIAAGHSMGAATALSVNGMVLQNPFSRQKLESSESRYKALLLLSEPGGNPTLPDEPWRAADVPTFIYTGTNDYGSESGENSNIPFEYAIVNTPPDPAPPKHHLWINDINHYLSGAWCRDPIAADHDKEAVAILRGVSTAFLDAYAKSDQSALDFLNTAVMPDRAGPRPTLSRP